MFTFKSSEQYKYCAKYNRLHREQYEQLEQYEHFEQMNEFRYILEPYKGLNSRIFSSSKEKSIY
jgi:acyl-homoserine lactone acylase PvdQ